MLERVTPGHQRHAAAQPGRPGNAIRRLLSCIRFDEVWVLQGAPALGAILAMPRLSPPELPPLVLVVAVNVLLVAHVFVFNDWAGIAGDLKDPSRASRTFAARGIGARPVGLLALALLLLALALCTLLGATAVFLALAIAGLSALYSAPATHGKGRPLLSSVLHILGGAMHFLLGAAAFPPLSWHSVAIALYFGIVFAAGHLTHEARDLDGDLRAGIRTTAVAFGRRTAVLASLALFTLAYVWLGALALLGILPAAMALLGLLYPLHVLATLRALRPEPSRESLRRLQDRYRMLHAVIGLAMVLAAWVR